MEPVQTQSVDKITQAIHLLEEASGKEPKYMNGESTPPIEQVQSAVANFRSETSRRAAVFSKDVHSRPWRYLAATAAVALGLGVLLGRRNA